MAKLHNAVISFSAVDLWKAWTDSQHCNQWNGLRVQVPAAEFLCQEGRGSGGEMTTNFLGCLYLLINVKFVGWAPKFITAVKNWYNVQNPEKDKIINGTYWPDDDEDNDNACKTPIQSSSPVFTQYIAFSPIPGSDSSHRSGYSIHYDYFSMPGNGRGGWMLCLSSWCTIMWVCVPCTNIM